MLNCRVCRQVRIALESRGYRAIRQAAGCAAPCASLNLRHDIHHAPRTQIDYRSDFRCTAGPGDKPFAEQHCHHSISYVRKGSFGLHCRGKFSELVAGSVLIGHPGDEYTCTHEHVCGDECLSFFLTPELVEAIGDSGAPWRIGSAPPLPELVVLGELAQAAADGSSDIGLDEIGQVLASRFVEVVSGAAQIRP